MSYNNRREFEINEDQIANYLSMSVNKVKTTENVDILSDLNKLFKKNVPLSIRKYVVAYMLKESLKHFHSFGARHQERTERNPHRERSDFHTEKASRTYEQTETTEVTEEERPRHPRVEIPEDQAASIFVSIGKNRRVYPRDLVGILIAVGGLDRERIGDIKVLANYSFVQLYAEDAQMAIDKLNGYEYRGRRLAVSFSKQKPDSEAEVSAEDVNSDYSADQQEMAAEDAAAYAAAERAAADKEPFGV